MNNKTILKQAIKKAVKNGYSSEKELETLFDVFGMNYMFCNFGAKPFYYTIIFDNKFAEAFWGEEKVYLKNGDKKGDYYSLDRWKYELQQMVLKKNKLKYIEKFLKVEK